MDGQPVIGEKVVVFGQGIVGLLTIILLSRFPLNRLISVEGNSMRRKYSMQSGAQVSFDPESQEDMKELNKLLDVPNAGADLVYELSGNPAALNQAISITGFDGRIVIGSWYGQKEANVDLGSRFHRSRIRLISSQVSTISPLLSCRWNKQRRLDTAWQMVRETRPSRFISKYFHISQAAEAYKLLDENPGEVMQVVFTY